MQGPQDEGEVLRDLAVRFLLNLPENEVARVERLFMQVELAYWFYEDHWRPAMPQLPKHKSLAKFAERLFETCDFLEDQQAGYQELVSEFERYKFSIPTFGLVLLNESRSKVVLVLNWRKTAWNFPAGKRNEGEAAVDCAIRETLEETGFDATGHVDPDHFLSRNVGGKSKLFVAYGVPEDFAFRTQTQQEIREVRWFDLARLPISQGTAHKTLRNLVPVINRLQRFVGRRIGSKATRRKAPGGSAAPAAAVGAAGAAYDPSNDAGYDNELTFGGALGTESAWDVSAMFARNEKLTGRQFVYDGNPSTFGDDTQAAVPLEARKKAGKGKKKKKQGKQAQPQPQPQQKQQQKQGQPQPQHQSKQEQRRAAAVRQEAAAAPGRLLRAPPSLDAFVYDRAAVCGAMRRAMGV